MTRASEPRHPRSAASSEAARRLSADTTTRPDAAEHIQRELSLIRELVNQDAHAWQTFTATYQNLIYARVRQTLSECQFSLSAADDVCADVFAELLDNRCASLRSFQGRSRLSTWLSVVTRRICLRFVTRQRPAPSMRLSDPSLALVTGDQPDADILPRNPCRKCQPR